MNKLIITILFLLNVFMLNSQNIENVHFEQKGKQIQIYYDLFGEAGEKYTIKVYCNEDGGDTWGDALKMVSGAVGEKQVPGKNNTIIWDVLAEREKLTGYVTFMITAEAGGSGIFTDKRDGKVYKWVRIGKQIWMAENLNVGLMINGKTDQKNNGKIEKYCYDNKETNCATYGGLYQWKEAMQFAKTKGTQGICPGGWHIPTDSEWSDLVDFLGGKKKAGAKMKEAGTKHWNSPNTGASNSSGFTGLPGGYRNYSSGSFYYLGGYGLFWSSSQGGASYAWYRYLYYSGGDVYRSNLYKTYGFSVRCLQD